MHWMVVMRSAKKLLHAVAVVSGFPIHCLFGPGCKKLDGRMTYNMFDETWSAAVDNYLSIGCARIRLAYCDMSDPTKDFHADVAFDFRQRDVVLW